MDNIIGRKLDGRYEIKEIIGVGGMAVVYKAYDSIDDRIVAVKVLKEEYLKNDDFRRRFKNESKAVAVLSHPNIVKVYDVSFGEKIQYIVMEYIDGITLKEYIDQQKVLTFKEAVHFTVQILRALQHAHERGIVHRDIKPQNIMMLEDGTIKVTDFGIARFAHSETKTMTDKAIGSVHYISPEQARGGITDEKSDIYSVGVMLYEMLTGKLPFDAENAVSVAIMQMQDEPKLLHEINPDVPAGLEEITLKAMQKDPDQRYKSALEMLEDIDRFKRNPSIHFQYKYFVDESPTKYVDAINEIKGDDRLSNDLEKNLKDGKDGKNGKNGKKGKKANMLPILAGITAALVLVVVALIIVGLAVKGFFDGGSTVAVPNLVGQQYTTAAANTAYTSIIQIKEGNTQYSSVPAGQIISQNPAASTKVKKNSVVTVVVSKGAEQLTVPDVYGEDKASAETDLKNQGFTNVKEQQQYNSNTPIGDVISTDPARGETAAPTDTITVLISEGPQITTVSVPSLTGLSKDAAVRAIQDAGLVVGTENSEFSSTVPSGEVTRQDPAANSQATSKSTVNIWISEGAQSSSSSSTPLPTVPNIYEWTLESAKSMIQSAGLVVGTENSEYSNTVPAGEVTRTDPAIGTQVQPQSTVNYWISKGPQPSNSSTPSSSSSSGK